MCAAVRAPSSFHSLLLMGCLFVRFGLSVRPFLSILVHSFVHSFCVQKNAGKGWGPLVCVASLKRHLSGESFGQDGWGRASLSSFLGWTNSPVRQNRGRVMKERSKQTARLERNESVSAILHAWHTVRSLLSSFVLPPSPSAKRCGSPWTILRESGGRQPR